MPNRFTPLRDGTDLSQLIAILNKNFGELDGETITKVYSVSQSNPGFIEGQLPNNLGYGFLMYTPDNKVAIACYIDSSGQPVLKIAKDGYDALTATDDQLIFNSAQNVFKIAATLTGSIAIDFAARGAAGAAAGFSENSTNSLVLPHGLTYIPAIVVYAYDTSQYIPISNGGLLKSPGFTTTNPQATFSGGGAIASLAHAFWSISVDGTNVTLLGRRLGFQITGAIVGAVTYATASIKVYCQQETAS